MKHLFSRLTKLTALTVLVVSLVACGGKEERKVKYLEKGKVYLEEKNYDKARIEFKNVLQIDPKFADAYYYLGQLQEKKRELAKALGSYRKAIELDPDFTLAKIKLAKIYVIAGTDDFINKAKKLLSEVKKDDIGSSEAQMILATIEYKTGSKVKATSELEKVIEADASLTEAISLLSTIYLVDNKEAKAINLLTKGASENEGNIPLRISLAKLLAKNKDYAGAEKYLKQAINIEPEKYALHVALSSFYSSSGQLNKAESVLRNAIEQEDEDVQRYQVLIEFLASRISIQKAEDELKRSIQAKPELYELKFSQVKFYQKIGRRDELKVILKQIIDDKSYDVEGVKARILLASSYLEEANYKKARSYVDEVIAEYPNNNEGLLIISKLALVDMDAISAINGLRTVVKNDPKNIEASSLLARAYELNKESLLAENELKKSIEADPLNDQAHVNYARYLLAKGRVDDAVDVIDKALAHFKDSYNLLDIKLKILASLGSKQTEMLAILNLMEQANSAKAEVNITKGQYYLARKNTPKAIEEFEIAYQKSNEKYKSLEHIIKVYVANGQADKAFARLQQRLDKNSEDAIANQLYGSVYLSQSNILEARSRFEQASKAADSWYPPYYGIASTYLVEKNPDLAISTYKKAIKKLKDKSTAQMQLASLYERKHNFSDAMALYKLILEKNSRNIIAVNNYASLLLDHGDKLDFVKALELVKYFDKLQKPAFQDTLGWAYAKTGDNVKAVEVLKVVVEKSPKVAIFRYHLGYALYQAGDKAAAKSHLDIAVSSGQGFVGKDKAKNLLSSI